MEVQYTPAGYATFGTILRIVRGSWSKVRATSDVCSNFEQIWRRIGVFFSYYNSRWLHNIWSSLVTFTAMHNH